MHPGEIKKSANFGGHRAEMLSRNGNSAPQTAGFRTTFKIPAKKFPGPVRLRG
jgi:hypothetical protein